MLDITKLTIAEVQEEFNKREESCKRYQEQLAEKDKLIEELQKESENTRGVTVTKKDWKKIQTVINKATDLNYLFEEEEAEVEQPTEVLIEPTPELGQTPEEEINAYGEEINIYGEETTIEESETIEDFEEVQEQEVVQVEEKPVDSSKYENLDFGEFI